MCDINAVHMDRLFGTIEAGLPLVVFAKKPFVWKFNPSDYTIFNAILQISTESLSLVEGLRVLSLRSIWKNCLIQ